SELPLAFITGLTSYYDQIHNHAPLMSQSVPEECGPILREEHSRRNHHRLEGGEFGSRLKARLLLEPEKTGDVISLALPCLRVRPPPLLTDALSYALEVVAY